MEYSVSIGRNITIGLLIVSGLFCVPLAIFASALFAHAPNRLAFFFPWLLIIGTWGAVWLLWKVQHWIPACVLLTILISIYLYFLFDLGEFVP
jgi:hypothetical protein